MGERTSTRRKREQHRRVCETKGCTTVLSIYNKQSICSACFQKMKPVDRPFRFGEL